MMSDSRRTVGITAVILLIMGVLCWGTITVGLKFANRLTTQETAVTPTVEDQYPGLMITAVLPNSPAAQAGLKSGHIILSANNVATNTGQQLQEVVDAQTAGSSITLILLVDTVQKQALVTRAAERPFLGIEIIENSPDAVDYLKTATPESTLEPLATTNPIPFEPLIVGKVLPDTPAEEVGLEVGDVLTAVDDAAILNRAELINHLANKRAGDTITLTFRRGPDTLTRSVTLAPRPDDTSGGFLGIELQASP